MTMILKQLQGPGLGWMPMPTGESPKNAPWVSKVGIQIGPEQGLIVLTG